MNKTLSLTALCLGAAALGGFIAVRWFGQPQPVHDEPKPLASISAAPLVSPVKVSPAAGGSSDRLDNGLTAIPSAQTLVKVPDDYDFESLSSSKENLEHRFDSEHRDPGWAPYAVDTVSHEVEGLPIYRQLNGVDVDCRTTLCRIESTVPIEVLQTTQNNHTGWAEAMSGLSIVPPWSTEFDNNTVIIGIDDHLGQAQLITYLHRRPQGAVGYAHSAS